MENNKILRDIVSEFSDTEFYTENKDNIIFELNHLELHGLDDYVLKLYQQNKKVSNPNNSNIAYLIGITQEKPKGRITTVGGSQPDIDVDFQDDRRSEIIQYLKDTYGQYNVVGIGTWTEMGGKGLFKDVARVYSLDFQKANAITDMIPTVHGVTLNLKDALEYSEDFKKAYEEDSEVRDVVDTAIRLEGCLRNPGVHASGYVVSPESLLDKIPLMLAKDKESSDGSKQKQIVTQFDMTTLEKIGYYKVDILGLKTLTLIDRVIKMTGQNIEIDEIDFNDQNIYTQIFDKGNIEGVFQIEGSAFKDVVPKAKIRNITDVSNILSLVRPGALSFVPEYIKRVSNEHSEKDFEIPKYSYIFKDSYGLMLYQEQISRLAVDMCGFTPSRADNLRKAIAKKDAKKLEELSKDFIEGAISNSIARNEVEKLWDGILAFGAYGFNKCLSVNQKLKTENGSFAISDILENNLKIYNSENELLEINSQQLIQYVNEKDCYRYILEDGTYVECTENHKFMTEDNEMISIDIIYQQNKDLHTNT